MKLVFIVWFFDGIFLWICRFLEIRSIKDALSGDELKLEKAALLGGVIRIPMGLLILIPALIVTPWAWMYSNWWWIGIIVFVTGCVLMQDILKKKPGQLSWEYSTFFWLDKASTALSMVVIGGYISIMNILSFFR